MICLLVVVKVALIYFIFNFSLFEYHSQAQTQLHI